jgi:hypothetical protein
VVFYPKVRAEWEDEESLTSTPNAVSTYSFRWRRQPTTPSLNKHCELRASGSEDLFQNSIRTPREAILLIVSSKACDA